MENGGKTIPSLCKIKKQVHKSAGKTKLMAMMFRTPEMTNVLYVTFFCSLPVYKFRKAKMMENVPFITKMLETRSRC